MSLVASSKVLAGITWLRLVRGRTPYITLVLALTPILLAAIDHGDAPKAPWNAALEAMLRFVLPLGAAIHVSGAVGDELEQKTFTYLWSRPMPRSAVVVARLAVMIPLLFALSAVSLLASFAFSTSSGATAEDLARGLMAVAASAVCCSLFAVGGGALFPRQPMLFTIGVFLTVEQFLFAVPAAKNLSIVAHCRVLAGLDTEGTSAVVAAIGLVVLGGLWLGLALLRVSGAEYAADKE